MESALAYLIAFWINPLLHGIYLSLFAYWLFLPRQLNALYFTLTCWAVFVLTNVDTATCLILLIQGFWGTLGSGGPTTFFVDSVPNMSWPFIWQEYNYLALITVCDALMVYRVWRLWQSWRWIAVIPFTLLCVETILRFVGTTYLAQMSMDLFENIIAASLAVNTAMQIVITLLLGYRLLVVDDIRFLAPEQRSLRVRITRALVESGAIISVCLILNLAFLLHGANIHWTFNLSIPHLYSITTMAIVVRLRATSTRSKKQNATQSTATRRSELHFPTVNVITTMPTGAQVEGNEAEAAKEYDATVANSSSDDLEMADIPARRSDEKSKGRGTEGVFIHTEVHTEGYLAD